MVKSPKENNEERKGVKDWGDLQFEMPNIFRHLSKCVKKKRSDTHFSLCP